MTNRAQLPIAASIKKRKEKIDEIIKTNDDINEGHVLSFLSSLTEEESEKFCNTVDSDLSEAAEVIRENVVRLAIRKMVSEVVRKKPGGGYIIFKPKDPKRDKGKKPQKVGETGSYSNALEKLASLTPNLKSRARYIKRAKFIRAHPEVANRVGSKFHRPPVKRKKKKSAVGGGPEKSKLKNKTEGIEFLKNYISNVINERLFKEEEQGSSWEEYISKMSPKALESDPKIKGIQKKLEKATETVLNDAFNGIKKAIGKLAKLETKGIKKVEDKTYMVVSAEFKEGSVGPIYIYVDRGVPKLELSQEADSALSQVDPDNADMFRGKLSSAGEKVLSKLSGISDIVAERDKYLEKIKSSLDDYASKLSPLQISLLKLVLMTKYRKVQ